jgi:hypothetical protein
MNVMYHLNELEFIEATEQTSRMVEGGAAKTNNTSEDYDDDDIVTYDYPNKSEAEV